MHNSPSMAAQRKQIQRMSGEGTAQLKHVTETYAGNYDGNEVRDMLNDSQGRNGSTGAAGHVREHVADAAGTQAYAQAENKMKTCFVNDAQQNNAVTSGLNSSTGQAELAKFDGPGPPNRVVISNVAIDQVNAWQSKWDAATAKALKSKKIHATKATLIVDRIVGLVKPEIHVQTAYPNDG